jgi:hypothetical protein
MKPDVYWIRDIDPLRFAMMPRPRGGEWLEDEVSGWKRMGIGVVVSLLHRYEIDELEISEEERMCVSHGIRYHSQLKTEARRNRRQGSSRLRTNWRHRSNRAQRSRFIAALASGVRVSWPAQSCFVSAFRHRKCSLRCRGRVASLCLTHLPKWSGFTPWQCACTLTTAWSATRTTPRAPQANR